MLDAVARVVDVAVLRHRTESVSAWFGHAGLLVGYRLRLRRTAATASSRLGSTPSALVRLSAVPACRELTELLGRLAEQRRLVWVTLEGSRYSPVAVSEAAGRDPETGCLGLIDFERERSEALALASMHGNWLEWIGPGRAAAV
jgi:hypothetical protein